MPRATIRDIFHGLHSEHTVSKCLINNGCKHRCSQDVSYTWDNKKNSDTYCVDCVIKGNRPDEFIFLNTGQPGHNITGIYLVERKTNFYSEAKVKEQLQGGANFIDSFIHRDPNISRSHKSIFKPVLVSRGITKSASITLLKIKVTLRGEARHVSHSSTGGNLPCL